MHRAPLSSVKQALPSGVAYQMKQFPAMIGENDLAIILEQNTSGNKQPFPPTGSGGGGIFEMPLSAGLRGDILLESPDLLQPEKRCCE